MCWRAAKTTVQSVSQKGPEDEANFDVSSYELLPVR